MRRTKTTLAVTAAILMMGTGTALAAPGEESNGAPQIRDLPFSEISDVSGATADEDDPSMSCGANAETNASVWYRVQLDESRLVTIDTLGSDYDTVVAVYERTGGSGRGFVELVCNDDVAFPQLHSEVQFQAERNETYFVLVDPFAGDSAGTLQLNAH